MTITIEARPYGPDSTAEEVEALRDCVSVHPDDIVIYREVPVSSLFQTDVCFDRVEELLEEHACSFMIVDVTHGGRPDAQVRGRIKERILALEGRIQHVAIVTANNVLFSVATKFIARGLPITHSVHGTLKAAEDYVRHAKR